jgi:hypothetical protein
MLTPKVPHSLLSLLVATLRRERNVPFLDTSKKSSIRGNFISFCIIIIIQEREHENFLNEILSPASMRCDAFTKESLMKCFGFSPLLFARSSFVVYGNNITFP